MTTDFISDDPHRVAHPHAAQFVFCARAAATHGVPQQLPNLAA